MSSRNTNSLHKNHATADTIFTIVIVVFMVSFIVITLYPVLNTVALSFSGANPAIRGEVYLIPKDFTLNHYGIVLRKEGIKNGAIVTVARTVIGTLLALVLNALLAFIISRKRFIFKSQLALFWVITMYVNGGMIPVLLLYKKLGLTGTFWVYVIPGMISAFNILVIRTYMQGIPDSLEESAQLDGAGYLRIFVEIISPLCKPVYATVALFVAVYQWNAWFDVLLYNKNKPKLTTLQYELQKLLSSVSNQTGSATNGNTTGNSAPPTPITVRAAATVVTMLPIICLYPFLQRYFVTGLTIGGVKE